MHFSFFSLFLAPQFPQVRSSTRPTALTPFRPGVGAQFDGLTGQPVKRS